MATRMVHARRLTALLAPSALWLVLWCAPALAHARLVEAEPAAGTTISRPTEHVRLRFSEPIEAEFSPLEVYDFEGERVDRDNARVAPDDARALEADLEELSGGSYRIEYRVTSVDGHVIDDTYKFTVAANGAGQSPDAAQAQAKGAEKRAAARGEPEQAAQEEGDTGGGLDRVVLYGAASLIALAVLGAVLLRRGS